ncbi:MAG: peptidyl-prolyl cis-trans isomerase [Pseudomonadota bacterium]
MFRVLAAVVLLASFAGCTAPEETRVIARVNQDAIRAEEFRVRLQEYRLGGNPTLGPLPDEMALKRRVLNELIEENLFLSEAKKRKLEVSSAELDAAIQGITRDYPGDSFEEQLKAEHLSLSRFRNRVRTRLFISKLLREVSQGASEPSRQAVEAYYKEHPEQFVTAEQVHLEQIVVKSREDAEHLLGELRKGAVFEQLAKDHSFTPEGSQGGDLGFVPRGVMPREVEAAVKDLKIGKVSGVVRTDYGFHILKVVERRPEHQKTLDEARAEIVRVLTEKQRDTLFATWRKDLLSKARIERNHGLLASIH